MKICSKCKAEKPVTEFHKDKSRKDGIYVTCKTCIAGYGIHHRADNKQKINAAAAERYRKNSVSIRKKNAEHYRKNKDSVAKRNALWAEKNPGKVASSKKAYYEKNKDVVKAKAVQWARLNPEKILAMARAYRMSNPDKMAANSRNRRALVRQAEGTHMAADVHAIFDKQRGLCASCNVRLIRSGKQKYHVDHIMPLSLGGSNWPANLQCLCPTCNLSKSAKHPSDWAKQQRKLL